MGRNCENYETRMAREVISIDHWTRWVKIIICFIELVMDILT